MSSKDTAIANGEKPTSVENGSILFCNVCEKRGMFLPGVHYSTKNEKEKRCTNKLCNGRGDEGQTNRRKTNTE